ncbi:hypothetical protein BDN71DRAFT_1498602 [Pleurotus eryngii]|uniref:Uncharacterized protein n=1 Tax=Pleurotus eryngii TaxID=5323 RepID=A0A9P5ZN24_PLEER|nr:hypothetical protein BDN71DRAFT_1498602 [Pleurotus eryngii]
MMLSFLSTITLGFFASASVVQIVAAVPIWSPSPASTSSTGVSTQFQTTHASVSAAQPVASAAPAANVTTVSEACTQARLDILVSLIVSEDATNKINATEPTTKTTVDAAKQGFVVTFTGIKGIAGGIFTNTSAPADSRSQVVQGTTETKTALLSINGTDAADPNLALAKQSLDSAIAAASAVAAECK